MRKWRAAGLLEPHRVAHFTDVATAAARARSHAKLDAMRTKLRTAAAAAFVAWASGCVVKSEPIDSEQPADNTGGSENASGGQQSMGGAGSGGGNVGGTTFLGEGETLVGSCMAPDGRGPCQDYLVIASLDYTEEDAYMHCAVRYDDAFSDALWKGGEHCPLEGACLACKNGSIIIYYYCSSSSLATAQEAEDACRTAGQGQALYWIESE